MSEFITELLKRKMIPFGVINGRRKDLSKHNPYHDELGRFTSGPGGSYGDESEVFRGSSDLQKTLLSDKERYLLDRYVRDGYKKTNSHLRRSSEVGDSKREKFLHDSKERDVADMDSAFKKTAVSCKRDMYLYRGMTLAVEKKKSDESWAGKLKVGDTITDKGFASASSEKGVARTFATSGYSTGVLFTIKVPKGKKAMAGLDSEYELILNRGSKFKVVGTKKIEDWKLQSSAFNFEIELELL